MPLYHSYDNVISAICGLRNRGFALDFRLDKENIKCLQTGEVFPFNAMTVSSYHYFDGVDDPGNLHVVFGLFSPDGLPGILKTISK